MSGAATGIPALTDRGLRTPPTLAGEAVCTYASANDSGTVSIWHPPVQTGPAPYTLGQVPAGSWPQPEPVADGPPPYGSGAFSDR